MVRHIKEFEFDEEHITQTCPICEIKDAKWMVLKLGTKWALFLCDDCIRKLKWSKMRPRKKKRRE